MRASFSGAMPGEKLTIPVSARDHIQGDIQAAVTLVEYGDFECPACGAAYPVVKALQESLGEDLCFVFRNFPLINMHPHAEHAAEAAEAAGAQGKYWEMHDALYENQDALEDEDLARYAEDLDLDVPRLIREVEMGGYSERIRKDLSSGVRSGVNGTPSFFINDLHYVGPYDFGTMLSVLNEARENSQD